MRFNPSIVPALIFPWIVLSPKIVEQGIERSEVKGLIPHTRHIKRNDKSLASDISSWPIAWPGFVKGSSVRLKKENRASNCKVMEVSKSNPSIYDECKCQNNYGACLYFIQSPRAFDTESSFRIPIRATRSEYFSHHRVISFSQNNQDSNEKETWFCLI